MQRFDVSLATVEENLALDEALLLTAEAGTTPCDGFVRVWRLDRYAVVLGRNRPLQRDVHVEDCLVDGVQIIRRASGGGTVLIGPGCLNLTLVLRYDHVPGLHDVRRSQEFVMSGLQRCLAEAGLPVRCAGLGDLVLGDRKCCGSAQRRLQHCFMHQASLLCGLDVERMTRYLREPDRQPDYRRGRRHVEFVANLEVEAGWLRRTLLAASEHAQLWGPNPHPSPPPPLPSKSRGEGSPGSHSNKRPSPLVFEGRGGGGEGCGVPYAAGECAGSALDPTLAALVARLVREKYTRPEWNLSL